MTRVRAMACLAIQLIVALGVLDGCSSKKVKPNPPFPSLAVVTSGNAVENAPAVTRQSVSPQRNTL